MDIKIGDVIKYKKIFGHGSQLGLIKEITEVKQSFDTKRIGVKEYHVSNLDSTTRPNVVAEKEIENVYRSINEVKQ